MIDRYRKKCFIKAKQDISLWLGYACRKEASRGFPLAALVSSNIMPWLSSDPIWPCQSTHKPKSRDSHRFSCNRHCLWENDSESVFMVKHSLILQRVWISHRVISQQEKKQIRSIMENKIVYSSFVSSWSWEEFPYTLGLSKFNNLSSRQGEKKSVNDTLKQKCLHLYENNLMCLCKTYSSFQCLPVTNVYIPIANNEIKKKMVLGLAVRRF